MKCKYCGKELEEGTLFCSNCGQKVSESKNICINCGAKIEEGASFCLNCGIKLNNDSSSTMSSKKGKWLKVVILCGILVLAYIGYNTISKARLESKLEGEWRRYNDGIRLILDFDDDSIQYDMSYSYTNTTITVMEYKAKDSNTIQVYYDFGGSQWDREIDVSFSDNGNTVKFSPAITNSDDSETFYKY